MENKLNSSSTNPKLVLYFLSLKKKLGLYPLLATPGLLALCINLNLSLRFFTNIFFTPTRHYAFTLSLSLTTLTLTLTLVLSQTLTLALSHHLFTLTLFLTTLTLTLTPSLTLTMTLTPTF